MVEDALGCEVVEAGLLGLEFKADQREGLAIDHADGGEGPEGFRWVLQNLIVDRGITRVHDLHSLIDRFAGATGRERNLVRGTDFHHWDERL